MNRTMYLLCAAWCALLVLAGAVTARAQDAEPTVYVIQKGDTLWGLSDRFFKDAYYWPNLWARNPQHITNPHFIFPGQKLKVYPDRIEVEVIEPRNGEVVSVYTDLGRVYGAKVGDRYSIYKKLNAISHPVTNVILGYRVMPLGTR